MGMFSERGNAQLNAEVNGVWLTVDAQNVDSEVHVGYSVKDNDGITAESRTIALPVVYDISKE